MPRRHRPSTAGLVFHVLNRSAKRQRLFDVDADYEAFERVLSAAVARSKVELYAYCAMPNHWHLLLSPTIDGELSRFMHWLTTTHARRWQTARRLDGQGAVYQGRFKAIAVQNDDHFLTICRYIERNPLRASLVERAQEWRWSSLSQLRTMTESDIELATWPTARPIEWVDCVNAVQAEAELIAVRDAIRRSQPYGDAPWTDTVRQRLGLSTRKRGRPSQSTTPLLEK